MISIQKFVDQSVFRENLVQARVRFFLRKIAWLFLISIMLTACRSISSPVPSVIYSPTSPPADSPTASLEVRLNKDIHIWSLGGNGWALRLGNRLLVFDYVESIDPTPAVTGVSRNLQHGYVNTAEIKNYEVYVFVTHSHQDHYDPVILEWEEDIDDITYFFGWQAGDNPQHNYLIGPRAHTQSGSMRVFTINSHHAGVPEVAFLVKIDQITIYHNGDYMASFEEDFEYLKAISDHIDIAFVIGWPFINHQLFQQAIHLTELFYPEYLFPICREGDEDNCHQFAELLADHGIEATVQYSQQRGDEFIISQSGID